MTKTIDYEFDPNDLAYHPEDSPEESRRRVDRACRHPGYVRFFHERVSAEMPVSQAKEIGRRTYEAIRRRLEREKEKSDV